MQRDSTPAKTAALITNSKTIGTFQDTMQSGTGVHPAGHFTVSGDPGSGKYPGQLVRKGMMPNATAQTFTPRQEIRTFGFITP